MTRITSPPRLLLLGAVLLPLLAGQRPAPAADAVSEGNDFFEKRVRPVLVAHCYECHGPAGKKARGGLRLDTRDGLMKGGDSGPALVPGDPDKSLLVRAVRHADPELRMPPKQKLADAEIADLAAWVKMGA